MSIQSATPTECAALDEWFKALPVPLSVLVVDDYQDDREMMKCFLMSKSINVLSAVDAKQAIELACSHLPDIIIMDIYMPENSGIDATIRLKELASTRHIPILALSNDGDNPSLYRDAIDAGCSNCLVKTVTLFELLSSIRNTLS
ncbi:MAG: response regulator [Proteobacteria bacterium]|nr:MAG: response regulator [Pseudomonadota bacterium]